MLLVSKEVKGVRDRRRIGAPISLFLGSGLKSLELFELFKTVDIMSQHFSNSVSKNRIFFL